MNFLLKFLLAKHAKPTDILSSNFHSLFNGLLVSNKLARILEEYNLPPHQRIEAQVTIGRDVVTYYWLHFTSDTSDIVDFERSIFTKYDPWTKTGEIVRIADDRDYKEQISGLKNLVQIKSFDIKLRDDRYDLINLLYLWTGILASDRLLTRLKSERINGFEVFDRVKALSID